METRVRIYNCDCLDHNKKILDESVDLGIFDPPFGLGEADFDKHYKRKSSNVLEGYEEAPEDYEGWTEQWMTEAKRILKPNGSLFVIMGHTNLRHVLNAAAKIGLREVNHCIWKYGFGCNTTKKFVTSHYHVLYYAKSNETCFNTYCRFGSQQRHGKRSVLHADLEDVFQINRDYSPGETKNQNKLPEELVKKIIQYCSNPGDTVCDFFMGNFTTAYAALKLGRNVCGYEINPTSWNYHMGSNGISSYAGDKFGCDLNDGNFEIPITEMVMIAGEADQPPQNRGKKIDASERQAIIQDFLDWDSQKVSKKEISERLQQKYQRGRFSIKNILDQAKADGLLTPNTSQRSPWPS